MNSTPLADAPYKGLMPYNREDAAFFFGRKRERELIVANLMASRLTLLYGPSGVGKSSVINAGVANELQELARRNVAQRGTPESVAIVFRNWRDDPVAELRDQVSAAIRQLLPDLACEELPTATLADYLQKWTVCTDSELLIILDQFEEYFLYHPQEVAEGTLAIELPRAINRPDLRVNFLISIREDALAKLDFFKGRIPNLFDNYLRIEHLARDSAREAIEQPIEKFNGLGAAAHKQIAIEPALVDAVLDQVKIGQVLWSGAGQGALERESEGARIETPYLQLVMTRLWDEETLAGSATLRLETLTRLGGAASIVRTHLDRIMSALTPAEQDAAAEVFRYLVTPSGSKIALTLSDLRSYTDIPAEEISAVLLKLSEQGVRILRTVNPLSGSESATRYEIFHDVLATSVLDWRARHVQARELYAVRKNLVSLILPFLVGELVELFFCFLPFGALFVWVGLRRRGVKKGQVTSIVIGWIIGWLIGLVVFAGLIWARDIGVPSLQVKHELFQLFLGVVMLLTRLLEPAGSILAFLIWRRRALAKLKRKAVAVALPAVL